MSQCSAHRFLLVHRSDRRYRSQLSTETLTDRANGLTSRLTSRFARDRPVIPVLPLRFVRRKAPLVPVPEAEECNRCGHFFTAKPFSLLHTHPCLPPGVLQLVVMPYAALLSRETRAAMGVRLEGAVVVIDEAHNIVEAINAVHSKKLTLSEVRTSGTGPRPLLFLFFRGHTMCMLVCMYA